MNGVFLLQISLTATVQIQQRQRTAEKVRVDEVDGVREQLQLTLGDISLDGNDDRVVISLLTEVIEEIKMDNQELNSQQAHIQVPCFNTSKPNVFPSLQKC